MEKEDKENNTFLRFLSGAVFDLYEDANGNKEFDSEDTKIGTLKNRMRATIQRKIFWLKVIL